MKDHPILFNGAMVRALLAGSKTQTRRVVKNDPGPYWNPQVGIYNPLVIESGGYEAPGPEIYGASDELHGRKCPYGQPGDRLWVRETFGYNPDHPGILAHCCYRADPGHEHDGIAWKPSIHMPRAASRILLEIVSVRVERLQDISEKDARAEGVTIEDRHMAGYCAGQFLPPSIRAYRDLWESISGDGSWGANPWVWVVEFKRVAP